MNDSKQVGIEERYDQLDEILHRVWCAALDAKVLISEEGGTEEQYLQKQRYHIDRAKTEIRNLGVEWTAR